MLECICLYIQKCHVLVRLDHAEVKKVFEQQRIGGLSAMPAEGSNTGSNVIHHKNRNARRKKRGNTYP